MSSIDVDRPVTSEPAASRDWLRALLVVFLCAAFGSHLPVISEHLREAPYMGVLFVVFTAACASTAVAVAFVDDRRLYLAAAGLCGAAVLTYAATRLVAFPQLADDVGNWSETPGVISVAAELCVVALALALFRGSPVGDRFRHHDHEG